MNAESPRPSNAHVWPRHSDNYYVEETWCDKRIFDVEDVPGGMVYDPHCGMGRVLDAAAAAGHFAFGSDIRDRGAKHPVTISSVFDLDFEKLRGASVFSNPPYSRAQGRKIVELLVSELAAGTFDKVALILPATFMYSDRAAPWFEANKPARVWIMVPRPSMPPGDVVELGLDAKGGKEDFAWHVWTAENLVLGADPVFRWLRRDGFNNRLFLNQEER